MNKDFLNIPIEFCNDVIRRKRFNQARIFIYYKFISSGRLTLSKDLINNTATNLKINSKTVVNHINGLINDKWISLEIDKNQIWLEGFERFAVKDNYYSPKGAIIYFENLDSFRYFIIGASMTYFALYIMRNNKQRRSQEPGLIKGRPTKSSLPSSYLYLPINYYAKVLNIPKSTVIDYKLTSIKAGYLSVEKRFEKLLYSSNQKQLVKKYSIEESCKFRDLGHSNLYKQLPDNFTSDIFLRPKRNLKEICKKNREEKTRYYKKGFPRE